MTNLIYEYPFGMISLTGPITHPSLIEETGKCAGKANLREEANSGVPKKHKPQSRTFQPSFRQRSFRKCWPPGGVKYDTQVHSLTEHLRNDKYQEKRLNGKVPRIG